MIPTLYAMRPAGPEITRRALLRRLRFLGVRVVTLPAGQYILSQHRPIVDRVVAELNADLGRLPDIEERLQVLFRPVPTPSEDDAA